MDWVLVFVEGARVVVAVDEAMSGTCEVEVGNREELTFVASV
jgi:hypothetical protein